MDDLFCLAILISLCSRYSVLGQSAVARIVGTVTDPHSALILGVQVTVTNTATQMSLHPVTDRGGYYQVLDLPIGPNAAEVVSRGFRTTESGPYTLEINEVLRVDVTRRIGDSRSIGSRQSSQDCEPPRGLR